MRCFVKKHSTGKLSKEQIIAQDKLYDEHHEYDYLFIGTGNSALTAAALLANKGYNVCMLEAHDTPGGYAHTFKMGEYKFCAQIHYIWGCGKGGKIHEFLKKIGLEKDITFELYDKNGYDHMVLPDGSTVKIPYGFEKLARNVEEAYPCQQGIKEFCVILTNLREEMARLPPHITWWDYITKWPYFMNLLRYKNKTLQNVFDECNLSKEAQAILCGQAGDFGAPPNELSMLGYVGLFGGYNTGAYYPTKHYKYYIERIAKFIQDNNGEIFYEESVNSIEEQNGKITGVTTVSGKKFTAKNYICNMDPQAAAKLIGLEKFPPNYRKKLNYDYSPSGLMIYLGMDKEFKPQKYGLGKHNTWHMLDWDMNKMWAQGLKGEFKNAWFFISTPTLHSQFPGIAPLGCHILEIATFIDYGLFEKALAEGGYSKYLKLKNGLANQLLDLVETYHIPDLRKHIKVQVVGSPTTNEDFCLAPKGNAYGHTPTPKNMTNKMTSITPFKNFYWCNATSGYGGMYGTVLTGMQLYMDLTCDRFYDSLNSPSDEEVISQLK